MVLISFVIPFFPKKILTEHCILGHLTLNSHSRSILGHSSYCKALLLRQKIQSCYSSQADRAEQSQKYLYLREDWLEKLRTVEFYSICVSQYQLLRNSLSIDSFAVFFRNLNNQTGNLEFIPVCSYPDVESVWIVKDEQGSLPFVLQQPLPLPGGLHPSSLLPDYPFVSFREGTSYELGNGYITVPINYERTVIGMLLISRRQPLFWTEKEKQLIVQVARSIAVAATLNLRWQLNSEGTKELPKLQKVLSNILHQVNNPLNAVGTFVKLLLKRLPKNDMNVDLLKNMLTQTEHLQQLLSPLQHINHRLLPTGDVVDNEHSSDLTWDELRIEQSMKHASKSSFEKPINLQLCWIKDVLSPLLSSVKILALKRGIRITSRIERDMPPCYIDITRIQEAVFAICENTLKYTPSGGIIRIHCYWNEMENRVFIEICDSGYGISENELAKVLERGYRGTNILRLQTIPGSGLGLSIALELVQSMNGVLKITSPGRLKKMGKGEAKGLPGTCVHIIFPRGISD
eukprot:jgi/Galph1/5156/GphlegSOOS_G3816.1